MPRKDHWDAVYTTKTNDEVSWYEVDPTLSLDLIQQVSPPPRSVIDVGGGQSFLVDRLLDSGIDRVAVLDISNVALNRTKERLGERAAIVEWVEADVTSIPEVSTISEVRSIPRTLPVSPTSRAATQRSAPAPHPTSTTVSPT